MPLSDVLHQDRAHNRLQRAFCAGRIPHAYLFTGPDGVGKEMLANRLAAVLLCTNPQERQPPADVQGALETWRDACGRCVDCELLRAGNHPDFHRIHRTLNKSHPDAQIRSRKAIDLSIDVIRHFLIARIGLRPSQGQSKVFIITEAERLSAGAQNAMLKTLEEPPAHSYLVLLATSADALLETTKSRCQQVSFNTLPAAFSRRHLDDQAGLSQDAATFLAELSQGSLGQAMQFAAYGLHDSVSALLDLLSQAAANPLACGKGLQEAAQELAGALKTQSDDDTGDTNMTRLAQNMILATASTILRDVQRLTVGHRPAALPSNAVISRLAEKTHPEAMRKTIQAVGTAEYQIRRSGNVNLIFDTLGIAIGRGLKPGARTSQPVI